MQFGFMPGVVTNDGIFMMRQMQEKYLAKQKTFVRKLLIMYPERLFGAQ